ncbi:Uncharacterised protein [uncultured archaeon]|nr:Uncharacterised protein [uncultured archaeon]
MNKRTITILAFTILLISGFASAQNEQLPMNPPPGYYGSITVNGQPAAAGTTITAMIGGEERGSITTAEPGIYGDDPGPTKLWIRSYQNEPGSTVTFYASGVAAQQTAKLPDAGTAYKADLTFVGVPVSSQAGTSGGSSGGSSSSGGGSSSNGGGVVNTTSTPKTTSTSNTIMTPGSNQSVITSEVTGAPTTQALSETPPAASSAINPAVIVGVVILLVSIIIAAPRFKKK